MNVVGPITLMDGHDTRRAAGKEFARLRCYALMALSDITVISAAFLVANAIYWGDFRSWHGVVMLSMLLPIYLGIGSLNRTYASDVLVEVRNGITRSLQALICAAAAILFVVYFLKVGAEFSRAIFALGTAGSIALLVISRIALRRPISRLVDGTPYLTIVVTDDVLCANAEGCRVIPATKLGFDPDATDPLQFHRFARAVAGADRVIVACSMERYERWALVLKSMTVGGEILTDDHDHLGIIGTGRFADRRTMVVASGPLDLHARLLKRGLDLCVSMLGLIVLSPIFVATAIAIRWESTGSIFFKQDRIGRNNHIFKVYKFRSMFADQSDTAAERLTTRNDSRVTKVGEFIRRTSIDELPQLLNVLKGDMSIVGPRPHPLSAKAADILYWDVDPRYRHRHSIKPGLTGLAQVRGFRGNTERVEDLTNRLQADLEYVATWSLWRDILIIVQTMQVLKHKNAF